MNWQRKGPKNITLAIVGNKCDLVDQEQVTTSDGEKYARECRALFMKTSAKENVGVSELFENLCDELIDSMNLEKNEVDVTRSRLVNTPSKVHKKKCCG